MRHRGAIDLREDVVREVLGDVGELECMERRVHWQRAGGQFWQRRAGSEPCSIVAQQAYRLIRGPGSVPEKVGRTRVN